MANTKKTTSKKTNTSLVKNPAGRLNGGTAPAAKKAAPKKPKTNPATAKKSVPVKRKAAPKRNGAGGAIIAAFGGAFAIVSFDVLVNRYAPQISGLIRTLTKFGTGFAVSRWGRKLPVIGRYSTAISYAFYFAGALDVVSEHIAPTVIKYVAPSLASAPVPVAPPVTVQAPNGQMGLAYQMSNGDQVIVLDESGSNYGGGYAPEYANAGMVY